MIEKPQLAGLIPLMLLGEGLSEGSGAKEAWLGKEPGLREKDWAIQEELRKQGVTAPRLGKQVSLPGKDIFGRRRYYSMSPAEQTEFETEYMPIVTNLLSEFISSETYQNLPPKAQRLRLFKYIHILNTKYGAATRMKTKYAKLFKAGGVKPSNIVPEGEEE